MQHHDDEAEFDQIIQRLYELREMAAKKIKSSISLTTAKEGFLNACQARQLSIHTISDYSNTIQKFIFFVGDIPMTDVTISLVTTFLASLPHSAKTVLNYHVGLAALWTWAIKQNYVDRHIIRMVDKPRPKIVAITPFTVSEIRAILNELRSNPERNRAIIYLLLDTGMRASELVGITKTDIDLQNRKVKVLGKGNKERFLPFSPKTASVLNNCLLKSAGLRPFPIKRTSLRTLMVRLGKRAGVQNCYPHRFRHTFAITYLRNGGDGYTLQEMLGHSTMEMVRRYLNIAQVDLENAHRRASPIENWKL